MLKQLFSKKKTIQQSRTGLDFNKLPILTAEELIQFTEQQNRIRAIKRIIKIKDEYFQTMYLDVIYNFAEIVQLMPASQAHHHAVPGGLFIHTLEVIEQAMLLRQKYKLPAFADQEIQEQERHAWTYAVFTAAILHDIGKRVTMCQFIRDDDEEHSAFEDKLLSETSCKHYRLVFRDTKYHVLHEEIGLALFDILPPVGKVFLFQRLNIVKEMVAYIHGNKHDQAGAIGEIITIADMNSTGKSLAHINSRKFKGANLENFGERLMTQLRQMIASNDFIINKSNANIYVGKEGYTYCVSKVIVDGIREEMRKNNESDVPADNNRIFDTFQEYGFAETNSETGKLIHYICIYNNGSVKKFSVLKFKTNKLFRVTPENYEGIIQEVSKDVAKQGDDEANIPVAESTTNHNAATEIPSIPPTETTQKDIQTTEAENTNQETEVGDLMDELITGNNVQLAAKSSTSEPEVEQIAKPEPVKKSSKEIEIELAEAFMRWCRECIKSKDITVNASNDLIQKVKHKTGAAISVVSPKAFYIFAEAHGMPNPKDKATYTKVQNAVHNNKLNILAPRGQLHTLKIKKSDHNPLNGNLSFRAYLFDIEVFIGNDTELKEILDTIDCNTNLILN